MVIEVRSHTAKANVYWERFKDKWTYLAIRRTRAKENSKGPMRSEQASTILARYHAIVWQIQIIRLAPCSYIENKPRGGSRMSLGSISCRLFYSDPIPSRKVAKHIQRKNQAIYQTQEGMRMSRGKLRYQREPRGQLPWETDSSVETKRETKKNHQFELLHSLNTFSLTGDNVEVFPQNVFLLAEARKRGRCDVRLDE